MALLTFPTDPAPSYPANPSTRVRVLRTEFGDGYSQRALDGLNAQRTDWQLQWTNTSAADAEIIRAFLAARMNVEAFLWTPPLQTVQIKALCQDWAGPNIDNFGGRTITATFEQVFDL